MHEGGVHAIVMSPAGSTPGKTRQEIEKDLLRAVDIAHTELTHAENPEQRRDAGQRLMLALRAYNNLMLKGKLPTP